MNKCSYLPPSFRAKLSSKCIIGINEGRKHQSLIGPHQTQSIIGIVRTTVHYISDSIAAFLNVFILDDV